MSFPTNFTAVCSVSSFSFLTISLHGCLTLVCVSNCLLLHLALSNRFFTSFLHTFLVARQHLTVLGLFSGYTAVRFASYTLLISLVSRKYIYVATYQWRLHVNIVLLAHVNVSRYAQMTSNLSIHQLERWTKCELYSESPVDC